MQHPGFPILQPELSGRMALRGGTNIPTVTLDRGVVDDEYGEDASTLKKGPRSLICPNLRRFALRLRVASAPERKEIERKCKQMVDTRRCAGQELECCCIWWGEDTTPSVVLDTSSDGFEVKR